MGSSQSNYRPDIDGMRAIAVCLVIAYHFWPEAAPGGFIGVDVFFVISGYLITSIINREVTAGTFSMTSFYERRCRRILPALLLVCAVTFAVGTLLLMPADLVSLGGSTIAAVLSIANIYWWWDAGYFSAAAETKPLLHLWSLGVEEQFYLLFPWLLVALRRSAHRLHIILAIGTVSLVASELLLPAHQDTSFYLLPFRAWELLAGAALVYVPPVRSPARASIWGSAGLIAIGGSTALLDDTMSFPGLHAVAPVAGAALIIWSGHQRGIVFRLLSCRPAVAIGTISYSLYLWHWPALVFAKYFSITPLGGIGMLGVTAFTVAASVLSWAIVERPFRNRAFIKRRNVFVSAACASAAIGLAGFSAVHASGFPNRLSASAARFAAASDDIGKYRYSCLMVDPMTDIDPSGPCHLGAAKREPTFILWGDSTAAALADGINRQARKAGTAGVLFAANSCPPLLGGGGYWPRSLAACAFVQSHVLKLIDSLGVSTVILHANWAALETPSFFQAVKPGATSGHEAFQAIFSDTVRELQNRNVAIVIVSSVPTVGFDVPSTLARIAHSGRDLDIRPEMSRFLDKTRSFETLLAQEKLTVIRPTDVLCQGERCDVQRKGRALYFDNGHLSAWGSYVVGPLFRDILSTIATRRAASINPARQDW